MARKVKVKKDIPSMLSSILICVFAILCFSFLLTFTDNFTSPLKDFYVRCGNDDIMTDRENFTIVKGRSYKFEIVNTLGTGYDDYIVSIVPNSSATSAFTFKSEGKDIQYQDISNLSKGFMLIPYDDYFVLTANMDLQEILQLYYPNATLTEIPTALDSEIPYFCLVVKVAGSTQVLRINFSLISE